ncbi:MAG: BspA family leucine-rich repeat surface protein [Bacilli bacterium]|nr:BspA family leucine-rich repeat surface protein [Bacilli bacterium]
MSNKKLIIFIIATLLLVAITIGVTYAFFSYTRTGSANTISAGRIVFNSEQTDTISLTNAFPITRTMAATDTTNTDDVVITISGDTTYEGGVEYLVTAVDVSNTIGSGVNEKTIPISVIATASNIGTADEEYFEHRGTSANSSIYKVLANSTIANNDQLLVGYIKSGVTGINGSLTIRAYLDSDSIAISDTYNGTNTPTDSMGTTSEWVNGRTVLTTTEWNSLRTNGVSFKVKVEAQEGTWVEEVLSVNVMNNFPEEIFGRGWDRPEIVKNNIKEVYFNKMGATAMQNAYDAATIKADLTYNNEGKVLAWLEENTDDNTKYNLIIASDGETYLTTGEYLFTNFKGLDKIEFNNVNTDRVTSMYDMFANCENLEYIDLSNLGGNNLVTTNYMFGSCSKLKTIIMENFNFGQVNFKNNNNNQYAFNGLQALETVNLTNADFSNVTSVYGLFGNCTSLTTVILDGADTSGIIDMEYMFQNCSSLQSINLSGLGGNNLSVVNNLFYGCNNLTSIDMSNFNFGIVNFNNNYYKAFAYLSSVETIDLTNADFRNVTSMYQLFRSCTNLKILILDGIDTSSVTNMTSMFHGDASLEKIYVSNSWNINNVSSSDNMFNGCSSLAGQAPNTTYSFTDYSTADKTYAVIATDSTVGYLTDISLKPAS